jgi:hypothetical protein
MNKELTITFTIQGTSTPDIMEKENKIREFLSNKNALQKFFEKYNILKAFI